MIAIREVLVYSLAELRDRISQLCSQDECNAELQDVRRLLEVCEERFKEACKEIRSQSLQEGYSRATNLISELHTRCKIVALENERLKSDVKLAKAAEREAKRRDDRTGLLLDPALRDDIQKFLRDRARDRRDVAEKNLEFAAVVYIDLDRMKAVNDDPRLGYKYGTRLVNTMTQLLRDKIRPQTTRSGVVQLVDPLVPKEPGQDPARMGGDEFAVLLVGLKRAAYALDFANRIKRSFAETNWENPVMASHRPAASIGVAILKLGTLAAPIRKKEIADQWIEEAEKIMKKVKHRANVGVVMLELNPDTGSLVPVPLVGIAARVEINSD